MCSEDKSQPKATCGLKHLRCPTPSRAAVLGLEVPAVPLLDFALKSVFEFILQAMQIFAQSKQRT